MGLAVRREQFCLLLLLNGLTEIDKVRKVGRDASALQDSPRLARTIRYSRQAALPNYRHIINTTAPQTPWPSPAAE